MTGSRKSPRNTICLPYPLLLLVLLLTTLSPAQQPTPISGTVLNAAGKPVSAATVKLQQSNQQIVMETTTTTAGAFTFAAVPPGSYTLTAEKEGSRSPAILTTSPVPQSHVNLVLSAPPPLAAQPMQFADQPNFTVAGVTDWTAVGGHGSDSTLRTSEDLARESTALQPQKAGLAQNKSAESRLRAALAAAPASFDANRQLGAYYLHAGDYPQSIPLLQAAYQLNPADRANEFDLATAYEQTGAVSQARDHLQKLLAHQDTAEVHRLSGELDEKAGDPLAAVHQLQQAVHLDPSEENYFAWGSELLLHRAVWQAADVFRNGSKAFPGSARMLTALGTALFAGALYDDAAASFCAAADRTPAEAEPYTFMGRVQMATAQPLPCVEPRLARFAQQQPASPIANYLYAMALCKRQTNDPQVPILLKKAVALDPGYADAYLQLGILAAAQHQPEQAITWYTRALAANPQLGEAHYRLGVAYDRSGAPDKARQQFELHDQIEAAQAADVERQRREVKQFLIVLGAHSGDPSSLTR